MNPPNEPSDDELRGWLRDLGAEGERRAPGFQGAWYAARTRGGEQPRRRIAWVAAATVIAMLLLAVMAWRPTPAPVMQAEFTSDEALPTDFLLATNVDDPVERLAGEIDALLRP